MHSPWAIIWMLSADCSNTRWYALFCTACLFCFVFFVLFWSAHSLSTSLSSAFTDLIVYRRPRSLWQGPVCTIGDPRPGDMSDGNVRL